jgi:PncC family amidohydrolase
LEGGSKIQQQDAFTRLVTEFGSTRVREGTVEPARLVFTALKKAKKNLVTAESCTGGLIAKLITDIPGSSEVAWGGFIVYSNKAKQKLLQVSPQILKRHGAVSKQVVEAMAFSALQLTQADYCIAVSGIAGPTGGTLRKPVGTVWICIMKIKGLMISHKFHFSGSRNEVRNKAASAAFLLLEMIILGRDYLDYCRNW